MILCDFKIVGQGDKDRTQGNCGMVRELSSAGCARYLLRLTTSLRQTVVSSLIEGGNTTQGMEPDKYVPLEKAEMEVKEEEGTHRRKRLHTSRMVTGMQRLR